MRNVIIISEVKQNLNQIRESWSISALQINSVVHDLTIQLVEGTIYLDFADEEIIAYEYEPEELKNVFLEDYNFLYVSYSHTESLKEFILNTKFLGTVYIDDDHGNIVLYDEFCKTLG